MKVSKGHKLQPPVSYSCSPRLSKMGFSWLRVQTHTAFTTQQLLPMTTRTSLSMWCPFGEFSRVAASQSAIDQLELLTAGYNEIVGHNADFSDHLATVPSTDSICPFIAHVHPSTSSANAGDGGRYNTNRWNSQSEVPNSYCFPAMNAHYNSHVDHFPPSTRTNTDTPTSGTYVRPFLAGQSFSTRGPNSISLQSNYPHSGSGAPTWERPEAHFQQPSTRRSNTQLHVGSSSYQNHGALYPSTSRSFNDANFMLNPFHHISERDPPHLYPHETGSYHHPGGGSARQRHDSGRIPSHIQYWS